MQGQATGKYHVRRQFFALGPFLSLLDFKHSGAHRAHSSHRLRGEGNDSGDARFLGKVTACCLNGGLKLKRDKSSQANILRNMQCNKTICTISAPIPGAPPRRPNAAPVGR